MKYDRKREVDRVLDWRSKNKDLYNAYMRDYRRFRTVQKQSYKEDMDLLEQATPVWADLHRIREIHLDCYDKNKRENRRTYGLVVAHMIPLRHELVCGLNVENNIKILTRTEKLNRATDFDPEIEAARQLRLLKQEGL